MRAPLGLRWNGSELENDYASQRDHNLIAVSPSFPEYGMKETSGAIGSSGTIRNFVVPDFFRSLNRSTIPFKMGYRPTTSYSRTGSYLFFDSIDIDASTNDGPLSVRFSDVTAVVKPHTFDYSSKLAPRVGKKLQAFNNQYGVSLAEGKETLSYLLLLFKRMRRALSALRRGDVRALRAAIGNLDFDSMRKAAIRIRRNVSSSLKSLISVPKRGSWQKVSTGNLWLEFRYGLTPLYYEICAVISDFTRSTRQLVKQYRYSVGHGEDADLETVHYLNGGGLSVNITVSAQARHRVGYILSDIDGFMEINSDGSYQSISDLETMIIRFLDPASMAWEVTPYSFVVDWFINIGDALQYTGSLYNQVKIIDGYSRFDYKIKKVNIDITSEFWPDFRVNSVRSSYTYSLPYIRNWTDSFPRISPEVDMSFSSFKHLVDAIFLVTQRMKR